MEKQRTYDIKVINKLSNKFCIKFKRKYWEEMVPELYAVIDIQLKKNYQSLEEYWEDLRQDVIMNLWKNRENVKRSKTKSHYQHYYSRIRYILKSLSEKYKKMYDALNVNIIPFDIILTREEKISMGIYVVEEGDYED